MKILKFILWITLLFCLSWTCIIFFGPALIANVTSFVSDGRVKLTRVEVSPNLTITVAAVDHALLEVGGELDLAGTSRAISVDWKIRGGFELFGDIGPSSLKNYGTVKSTSFTIEPNSIFDWSKVRLQLEFEQLVGANLELAQGRITGNFVGSFQELKDVELFFPSIIGKEEDVTLKAIALNIKMDRYYLGKKLSQQNSEMTYSLEEVMVSNNIFESPLVTGSIKLSGGQVLFKVSASDAQFSQNKVRAKSITISSRQLLSAETFEDAWDFAITDIVLKSPNMNIESYSGDFFILPTEIELNGRAVISSMELKTGQYFIGQIENGLLDISLSSRGQRSRSRTDLGVQGSLILQGVDGFSVEVSIGSALPVGDIFNCFKKDCVVDLLEAEYKISASGHSLVGNVKCRKTDCVERPLSHVLKTDNTNLFFEALTKIGVLNPLLLPIAYFAVSGGEVVGVGHILSF